jgi:hypothetical protein
MQYAPQLHPSMLTFPYPYPANIDQYNNQQYTIQLKTKVISPDENSVLVSEDGLSWKKVNLEKMFS